MNKAATDTPMMRQYLAIKEQHPDAVLLYRMGDFYETFLEDAETVSKILGLTLTARGQDGVPLAGFPHHQLERYLPRLVSAGRKVAICEQAEDPAQAKGLVRREVTEVVTRGTTLSEACLDERQDNLLAAVRPGKAGEPWGVAFLELSTGLFEACEGPEAAMLGELERARPVEVLWPDFLDDEPAALSDLDGAWSRFPAPFAAPDLARRALCEHFGVASLEGFGWAGGQDAALSAAGAALRYAGDAGRRNLAHVRRLSHRGLSGAMLLDAATLRNLEILRPMHDEGVEGSLAGLLDRTRTAMGARLLRRWLARPLYDRPAIEARQSAVERLRHSDGLLGGIQDELRAVADLERLGGRLATQRVHARDLVAAGRSLEAAERVGALLSASQDPLLSDLASPLAGLARLAEPILAALVEAPPLSVREGGLLKPGTDAVCNALEEGARDGRASLAALQQTERERTGIGNLKVGFNKVFGYYIEVSRAAAGDRIPERYQRRQTLVGAERYVTEEMKRWEEQVLGAEEKIRERHYEVFCQLRDALAAELPRLQAAAAALSAADVLCAFAESAERGRWVRPRFHEGGRLDIKALRHPVIEAVHPDAPFVPNDLLLDPEGPQIQLLTGPNMAGKSTYLRQAGLVAVMAHAGCPVAAEEALIPLVDRVFTRVGASDRLSRGQSTFLVEMLETANILHNATPRSLVLLDEVGRGTSTFDGLSLAWAIAEALHENPAIAAKTLFATHYHEMTALAERLPRVENLQVLVREHEGRVVFLHRVAEGACDSSYGIHVARMAGVPEPVLERARGLLLQLEAQELRIGRREAVRQAAAPQVQLSLFAADPALEEIRSSLEAAEPARMTPIEALLLVQRMKDRLA